MDRLEQKIDETLKMLSEEPPETLGNRVMASLRSQKPSKNRSFVWIGLVAGCVLAVVATAGIIFIGPRSGHNSELAATSAKLADESARDSYGVAATPPADSAGGAGSTAGTSENKRNATAADTQKPEPKAAPKPESRPGTKEEIDDANRPLGVPNPKIYEGFPGVSMTSVSVDPWKAWADCGFLSNGYGTNINMETLTKDDKIPGIKKTYRMTATIFGQKYEQWLEMIKKISPAINNPQSPPGDAKMINVTITFEPKK